MKSEIGGGRASHFLEFHDKSRFVHYVGHNNMLVANKFISRLYTADYMTAKCQSACSAWKPYSTHMAIQQHTAFTTLNNISYMVCRENQSAHVIFTTGYSQS